MGGNGIPAPTTVPVTETEAQTKVRGLMIVIPGADVSDSNKTVCKRFLSNRVEEEEAAAPPGFLPCPLPTRPLKATLQTLAIVESTTIGDTSGVVHDSCTGSGAAGLDHRTAAIRQVPSISCNQAFSQCTEQTEQRNLTKSTKYNLTDLRNSHRINIQTHDSCNYFNVHNSTKQDPSKLDAYSREIGTREQNLCTPEISREPGCHTPQRRGPALPAGGNWLRAVKPDVDRHTLCNTEESWPPLIACKMKGDMSGCHRKNSTSSYTCNQEMELSAMEKQVYPSTDALKHTSTPTHENQMKPYSATSQEVLLDYHCWPALEKSCRRSGLHDDFSTGKKRRTLQPLSSSNFQCPDTTHQNLRKVENLKSNIHIPPMLLMLNKDFIVTSPLKENLLLTLALMAKRPESPESPPSEGETKRQVLVGQFKAFSSFLHFLLGRDAMRVRTESNAGGTSTISESLSVEYFVRRFQAKDIVTEMEVEYRSFNWKKVDYICTLYGQRVGVSVTRAMSFPDPKDFSAQMAYRLLYKKLFGLVVARHGVSKRHSFSQCILHVWCETQETASIVQREYEGVSQELDIADDVVMVLTVADGRHARPIFYESVLRNASK